jgi:hypothetical protein
VPSVNRVFLEDLSTECEDQYDAIKAARKMSRVEIMTSPHRSSKFLLLKFPCKLSADPFTESAKKDARLFGKLECMLHQKTKDGTRYSAVTARVVFRVTIASTERALEVTPKKPKLSEQLPRAFASMSL